MLYRKGFAHILLVLVVVLLGLGVLGYFSYQKGYISFNNPNKSQVSTITPISTTSSTPINDLTENWKTYRNEKYGYEFKYPQSLDVEEMEIEDGNKNKFLQTVWIIDPIKSKPGAVPKIVVNVVPMINYLPVNNAKEIFINYKKEKEVENLDVISEGVVDIRNYPAYQVIRREKAPKPYLDEQYLIYKTVYIFENKLPISIEFGEWITEEQYQQKDYWPLYGNIQNQILSTFKFTEKIYPNKDGYYTLKGCGTFQPEVTYQITPPNNWTVFLEESNEFNDSYKLQSPSQNFLKIVCGQVGFGGGCDQTNKNTFTINQGSVIGGCYNPNQKVNTGSNLWATYLKVTPSITISFDGYFENINEVKSLLSTFNITNKEACTQNDKLIKCAGNIYCCCPSSSACL